MPTTRRREGDFTPCQQYFRLFGNLTPEQVILEASPSLSFCDPDEGGGASFSPALRDVAALRELHRAKGYTVEADARHGPMWFWHGVHEFWWKAQDAGPDRERRRKAKIAAAALLIASIEADDFLSQQQEQNLEP